MSNRVLVRVVNAHRGSEFRSIEKAEQLVASGQARWMDKQKRSIAFQKLGKGLTAYQQQWAKRRGESIGEEWSGQKSGYAGPQVMQLHDLRERGVRAVQRRLGLEPTVESKPKRATE